jgi:uncharacterized membrane protein
MQNALCTAAALMLLTGCGLADVGATGATSAASAAQEAKQAKETEAQVRQQVDAAYQQAAEQRKAAEAGSQ